MTMSILEIPLLNDSGDSQNAPNGTVQSSPNAPSASSTERIYGAKSAYAAGDADASKQVHQKFQQKMQERKSSGEQSILDQQTDHPENTLDEGEFVRPAVFGGLDGVSTSFSLLAGAVGLNMGWSHLIGISCAQVFAGAFAMGFGEYVSAKAERQIALRERNRERWEVENFPEGEICEMIDIYTKNGLSYEDAEKVARTLSRYPKFWVDHMLLHEIGILPPSETDSSWRTALAMFFSFIICGSMPILSYIFVGVTWCGIKHPAIAAPTEVLVQTERETFMQANNLQSLQQTPYTNLAVGLEDSLKDRNVDAKCLSQYGFDIAILVTLLTLFILGYCKNAIAEQNAILGGVAMAFQGAIAGSISYYVGVQIGGATS